MILPITLRLAPPDFFFCCLIGDPSSETDSGEFPPLGNGEYLSEGGVMRPGRKIVQAAATAAVAFLFLCGVSSAEEFLLGKETKGVTLKAAENTDLTLRVRLSPRFDAGDLIKSDEATPTSYETETDFYLRRVRLEFSGHLAKNLTFNVSLRADTNGQAPGKTKNTPSFLFAYGEYKFADALSVRFGKSKLPYSRVSLTSAATQLFIERPFSTEAEANSVSIGCSGVLAALATAPSV